jgi:hypothetical protein
MEYKYLSFFLRFLPQKPPLFLKMKVLQGYSNSGECGVGGHQKRDRKAYGQGDLRYKRQQKRLMSEPSVRSAEVRENRCAFHH